MDAVDEDINEIKRGYIAHNQAVQVPIAPKTGVVSSTMAHSDPSSHLTTMPITLTKKASSPDQRFTWGEQMELKVEAEDRHSLMDSPGGDKILLTKVNKSKEEFFAWH